MALLQEILVPLLAVNDTSLTVVEMNFPAGSKVLKGDTIMVFETSKTTYDVEAGADGYIQYNCLLDHDYEVNQVVARIYSEAAEAQVLTESSPAPLPVVTGAAPAGSFNGATPAFSSGAALLQEGRSFSGATLSAWEGETLFSAAAIKLISTSGIDRSRFAGMDFVTARDVQALLQPQPAGKSPAKTASSPVAETRTTLPADPQKVILERLSSGKKREIEYLGDVQSTGLTSTINTYVETEGIFLHMNRSLKYLKDSLLPVIIYESSRLLTDYPFLNAYFTGDAIACYKEVNPGFAIDIEKGLKVLKIAGAGQQTMGAIEEEILRLSGSYLDETLLVEDLTDITFTITDLSAEGVAFFRPLVNKMNSAILGVSAIDEKLHRCTLSLTFDHRVTEGKLAARFLKELKDRLESYRDTGAAAAVKNISCFKCYKTLAEDLSGAGFAHCITPEGHDGYICQSCIKGF